MGWRKAGGLPGVEATGQGVCCLQRLRAKQKVSRKGKEKGAFKDFTAHSCQGPPQEITSPHV